MHHPKTDRPGRLGRAINVSDLRAMARRRLPAPLFHYIDGGSEDESNVTGNVSAFEGARLVPEMLVDVSNVDLRTRVFGRELSMPLFLSPTGMTRFFHHEGERAVARAAAAAGTCYSLSTLGSTAIEAVSAACDGPKCFQIYVMRDRGLTREFIQRCKDAKFDALALTVDVPLPSKREREIRYGFSLPPRITARSLAGFLARPRWLYHYLRTPKPMLANVAHRIDQGSRDTSSLIQYVAEQFDPSVTWKDMEWMIGEWGGPFAIKGLLSPADARRAVDIGASAVMVSNHGGRQLDGALSTFEALGPIADEVGGECDIILDGGIRRGTHVLKALARGATACSTGRPYLWGLAAGGEAGVRHVLETLKEEIRLNLGLLGCRSVGEVSRRHLAGV